MPEQTIASYISNLVALAIIVGLSLFLFVVIFIISKILIKLNKQDNATIDNQQKEESKDILNKPFFKVSILNKDPNIFVNISSISFFFLFVLIFLLIFMFFLIFNNLIVSKIFLFFISFILFLIISSVVYIVKSKIFNK